MPDYSKSIIYKLCCKDANITDIYIGATCNFTRRKHRHKTSCLNKRRVLLYDFINKNGGWDNWDMIMLEEFSCENKRQRGLKEREWIEKHKPSLNICIPTRTPQEYNETKKIKYECQCGSILSISSKYSHELTFKHLNYLSRCNINKKII